MGAEYLIDVVKQGLILVLILSAAPVLTSMLVGLIVSIFQAMTQIQDQTISFVPKVIAVFVVLILIGPWIGIQLVKFAQQLFIRFPELF